MHTEKEEITLDDFYQARLNGISRAVVISRVDNHKWAVADAITIPIPTNEIRPFKEIWKQWRYVAKKNNINRMLFYNRVKKLMWEEERAATEARNILISKHTFTAAEEKAMQENGLEKNIVIMRIENLEWSREEAVSTPVLPRGSTLKDFVESNK